MRELGFPGQIRPFVRIGFFVVEFLVTIVITCVAILRRAYRVVVEVVGRERGARPLRLRVHEQRINAHALEKIRFRQTREVAQCGINAEKLHRRVAAAAGLCYSGRDPYERRTRCFLPQRVLAETLLLAEMPAVVT